MIPGRPNSAPSRCWRSCWASQYSRTPALALIAAASAGVPYSSVPHKSGEMSARIDGAVSGAVFVEAGQLAEDAAPQASKRGSKIKVPVIRGHGARKLLYWRRSEAPESGSPRNEQPDQ